MEVVTIALAKGRLADRTMELLEAIGIDCAQVRGPGRRLVFEEPTGRFRFILVKPSDVPTYVDHGVADIGVAGKDTLMEENRPLYELLDLGFGKCKLCIAGFPEGKRRAVTDANFRVATKYPNIAREYYGARGQTIEIIKLNGSVELGPLVGLSDVILDVVESGGTLRANGLVIQETVVENVSARMVVNCVSLKTKGERIRWLIDALAAQLARTKDEEAEA